MSPKLRLSPPFRDRAQPTPHDLQVIIFAEAEDEYEIVGTATATHAEGKWLWAIDHPYRGFFNINPKLGLAETLQNRPPAAYLRAVAEAWARFNAREVEGFQNGETYDVARFLANHFEFCKWARENLGGKPDPDKLRAEAQKRFGRFRIVDAIVSIVDWPAVAKQIGG